jgi:hypothetical protein
MDKKRIDIDDLVRQRLSGPEAPMPPHAWNKMSALLDEHMPQPAMAHRGRRFLGLFLLLGTLAGSAGYAVWQNNIRKTGEIATLLPVNTTLSSNRSSTPSTPLIASNVVGAGRERTPVVNTSATSGITTSVPPRNVSHTEASKSAALPANHTGESAPNSLKSKTESAPQGSAAVALRNPQLAGTTASQTAAEGTLNTASNNSNLPAQPLAVSVVPSPHPAPVVVTPPARIWSLAPAASRIAPASSSIASAGTLNASKLTQLLIGEKALKDLNRLDQYSFSAEGLSARKATKALKVFNKMRAKNLPYTVVAADPPVNTMPALAAATPAIAATQSALLVPLANYKVASRKSGSADEVTAGEKLSNVMENVKQTAAQTRFYAGTLAGISSTLAGAGSLQGFHFGLMGMMAFSERFALVTELRYLRQFNGSSNLRDDYYKTYMVSESAFQQNGQSYNVYRYDLDSNVSSYKFEGVNTFQLPIYARIGFNRFSLLGGLNLSYHMRTDVEQGGARIATISRYDTLLTGATPPLPLSRAATINVADFGPRFGIGYVAGAAYNLSPSLSLDMRITQQVWDNKKHVSEGARTISKTYFQLPTLQLSVGYRFQQRAAQPRHR